MPPKSEYTAKTLTLKTASLNAIIFRVGFKKWWIAEQLKISKRTVLRWCHGDTKEIKFDNAQALALLLDCSLEELIFINSKKTIASSDVQLRQLLNLLKEEKALELFIGARKWRLIKEFAPFLTGQASTIKEKILLKLEEARANLYLANAKKAQKIAEQALKESIAVKDKAIKSKANQLMGEILFYAGDLKNSSYYFHQASTIADKISFYQMLPLQADTFRLLGQFSRAKSTIIPVYREVINGAEIGGIKFRFVLNLGVLYMDLKEFNLALQIFKEGLSLALSQGDLLYRFLFEAFLAKIYAETGKVKHAHKFWYKADLLAKKMNIKSLAVNIALAAIRRAEQNYFAAHKILSSTLKLAINRGIFPLEIYEELCLNEARRPQPKNLAKYLKKCEDLSVKCQAPKRFDWLLKQINSLVNAKK